MLIMKQSFTKREILFAAVSILLIISAGIYSIGLRQTLSERNRLIASQSALLKEKDASANETASYIETICAEYRTLYQSYRELRYPDATTVDRYAGLPGSAKGQIDKCYLPD